MHTYTSLKLWEHFLAMSSHYQLFNSCDGMFRAKQVKVLNMLFSGLLLLLLLLLQNKRPIQKCSGSLYIRKKLEVDFFVIYENNLINVELAYCFQRNVLSVMLIFIAIRLDATSY